MKRFTRQVLAFALLLITITGTAFLINYFLINDSKYFKLSEKTKTIVVGHSHPECAYNDSLISNFKNIAQSGEAYFYTYLKVKKILRENKQVKNILIEFEPVQTDTIMNSWTWDDEHISASFAKYLPLMDYPEFSLLWQNNSNGIISFFPKSFIKRIVHNLLFIFIMRKNIETDNQFGGYKFLDREKTDSLLKDLATLPQNQEEKGIPGISHTNIHYLSKIINYCNQKGVHVILIRSPLHKSYGDSLSESRFKNILHANFSQTEFIDLRNFPLRNDQFGDLGHLNYKGAEPYSLFFDHLLKMNLLQRENKQAFIEDEMAKITLSENKQNK